MQPKRIFRHKLSLSINLLFQKDTKLLLALFVGLFLISSTFAQELKVYDEDYKYQYRIEGQKVYDKDWNLLYRIENNNIYDKNWNLRYRIQNDNIYDKDWNLKYRKKGNLIYDKSYKLRYRLGAENH